MTDGAVNCVRAIHAFAKNNGAVVDRIEVTLHGDGDNLRVEFMGYLSPLPLEQNTAAVCYYPTQKGGPSN